MNSPAQDKRDETPCYVARCLCGCGRVVYASVDDGTHPKETAKSVAAMIRKGYQIERMAVSEVRTAGWICANKRPQEQQCAKLRRVIDEISPPETDQSQNQE